MAPEGELKKRVARKLTKKRKEGQQVTMEIPERFKDGDDADEDCTAIHGGNAFMNQSVFGMIAAAGSQVDFNARFDAQSSDEEDETEPSSQSSELQVDKTQQGKSEKSSAKPDKHKRKFSENKLLRSIPRLGKSKSKSPRSPSSPVPEFPSEPAAPAIQVSRTMSNHAPVMSRMLEARAELSMRPSFDLPRNTPGGLDGEDEGGKGSSSLAKRLMEIFGFETAEDVIEGISPVFFAKPNTNSDRIPLLVIKECITSRLYVHYNQAHLFLCIFTKEICKLDFKIIESCLTLSRMKSSSPDTFRSRVEEIPNLTDTGFG
jgi:sterol 3beta-glucosyltransferase